MEPTHRCRFKAVMVAAGLPSKPLIFGRRLGWRAFARHDGRLGVIADRP
jgi:hypothetical protein